MIAKMPRLKASFDMAEPIALIIFRVLLLVLAFRIRMLIKLIREFRAHQPEAVAIVDQSDFDALCAQPVHLIDGKPIPLMVQGRGRVTFIWRSS